MRYDSKIVGDEHVDQPEIALQLGEQIQHVAADRHVQRGHHLVAHDQLGTQRQRARNHHALLLAAGKLMRIARADILRQADAVHGFVRALRPDQPCPSRASSSGSSTEDRIVIRGFSAAFGSWKMIW